MTTLFLAEAELEMNEAAHFYEIRTPGLGLRFLDVVDRAIADIELHPAGGL